MHTAFDETLVSLISGNRVSRNSLNRFPVASVSLFISPSVFYFFHSLQVKKEIAAMADTFQVKLVEAVEKHQCLYNFHMKEYSNRDKVSSAWEAVAQEVESSGIYNI